MADLPSPPVRAAGARALAVCRDRGAKILGFSPPPRRSVDAQGLIGGRAEKVAAKASLSITRNLLRVRNRFPSSVDRIIRHGGQRHVIGFPHRGHTYSPNSGMSTTLETNLILVHLHLLSGWDEIAEDAARSRLGNGG